MKIKLSSDRRGGFVGVLIGIIAAVVLGIIVYKIGYLLYHVKPRNPDPDGDSASSDGGGGNSVQIDHLWKLDSLPSKNASGFISGSPVKIQYELNMDASNNVIGKLCINSDFPEGQPTVLIDNENEYEFYFSVGGITYYKDYQDDPDTGELISNGWSTGIYTGNPFSCIVERSTNGCSWESISTNSSCNVGEINTFSDSTAPSDHAMYRLKIIQQATQ